MEALDPKLPFRIDEKTSRGLLSVTNSINPEIIRAIHSEKVIISVRKDSLSFSDSVYLLHERGKSMQEAVPEGRGSMLAVMGLKTEDIKKYLSLRNKDKGISKLQIASYYHNIKL